MAAVMENKPKIRKIMVSNLIPPNDTYNKIMPDKRVNNTQIITALNTCSLVIIPLLINLSGPCWFSLSTPLTASP